MQSWRDLARPVIASTLAATAGQSENVIRKALFDAYPFGERAHYPYKVWLDEIARQRGKKRGPKCGHKVRGLDFNGVNRCIVCGAEIETEVSQ